MNLHDDDFTLFDLPRQFVQDRAVLDQRWKALQRQAHPDKFANQGEAAQRVAMQWSVRINEAYQRLKNPLQRAAYLCELAGFSVQAHSNTAMPAAFLMQQMEWREALEDAGSLQELETLWQTVQAAQKSSLNDCAQLLDVQGQPAAAVGVVRSLLFIEKLLQEIQTRLDALT